MFIVRKDDSNAPATCERSNPGKCLCTFGPGLYHGVWNYQTDQLRPRGYLHDRCLYGLLLINSFQVDFFVALLIAMVGTAILGVVIEYLAYRPLRHSTRIAALITAIGVSFLLEYGMVYLVGANTRAFPQAIETVRFDLVRFS